jgi:hypothetical protein
MSRYEPSEEMVTYSYDSPEKSNPASSEQITPKQNDKVRIVDCVMRDVMNMHVDKKLRHKLCNDLLDRAEVGYKRYGAYLQPYNGRNNFLDAYQECLDMAKYMRNQMEETPGDPVLISHYGEVLDLCCYLCGKVK